MTLKKSLMAALTAALCITWNTAFADSPKKLGIGLILSTGPEAAWDNTLLRDIETVKKTAPHDLQINIKHVDGVEGEKAKDAMELLARSGKYQIIWAHSSYSDQIKEIKAKYPNVMFVMVGSGNEGLGGNAYFVYKRSHEPSYLLGVLAGRLTKSGVVGVVGQFSSEDVNDQINSFFAGAHSVNPAVKHKVAFTESWYDPAKAEQFTNAQIAAGADMIFQLAGSFETCEKAHITCFGNYVDQGAASLTSVAGSALISWVPDLNRIIDAWYDHAAHGVPFNGNVKESWIPMAQGGTSLSGYHAYENKIPSDVKAEITSLRAKINSGELVIPVDLSVPVSN